jgi:hypothetical protein
LVPSRSTALDDVHAEYTRRLDARRKTLARQVALERRIADARLLVFIGGLVLAWFSLIVERVPVGWLALPAGLFLSLVVAHEYARRASHRAERATIFYEKGLARLEDRWAGTGEPGTRFLDPDHPYAADLDLFGTGSVFERLCAARTRAGEATLASWLLRPAAPETIAERHAAVTELRPCLDLREDLELLGSDVRAGIDPAALASWGATPRAFHGRSLPITAALLAALALATLVGWLADVSSLSLFFLIVVVEIVFAWRLARRVRHVITDIEQRTHDLVLLSALLRRLEREPFEAPALRRLRAALETGGQPASRQIARLARLLHLLDTQKNQFFLPIAAILLWGIQLSFAIDAWRGRSGPAIAGWLDAVGEFEALCALAAYAAENPNDPFPEVVNEGVHLDAEGIGHPLIAAKDCVRNDLSLGNGSRRVLVVSGSNMSGKSTLLRSVGVNVVLAQAGAPVRARRLRLSPLSVGATLRIQDSLQAGKSRFYAEITRVRQLMDLARSAPPLLFLLDELFHGTNSHDRCVGAEAIVRGLIERGAMGLVTTHDLALAAIVDQLAPMAENVHFEDQLEDGVMHFDYRMRPGVVQHSNALALMRAVGLEV